MDCMSDIELCESVKMVKDEEEMEDMRCKSNSVANGPVVRTLDSDLGGSGKIEEQLQETGMSQGGED